MLDNVINLQSGMLTVQSEYQKPHEVNQQLRKQIADHELWEQTAARYRLTEVASGIFVYVLKDDCRGDEPEHWLCPNCFQTKRKSIISKFNVDYLNRKCHNCGLDICTDPGS